MYFTVNSFLIYYTYPGFIPGYIKKFSQWQDLTAILKIILEFLNKA